MLKKIILDYVESIDALRDFEASVKLRLEEHVNRSLSVDEELYSHLLNERWGIAEGLSYFQMGDKQTSEKSQIYGQLNYWQSVKWQDRFEEVRREVEQADFSAKDPLYQLALLALQNDTGGLLSLLPIVLRSGKLTIEDFNAWPIFREKRKADAYRSFIENEENEPVLLAEERSASSH